MRLAILAAFAGTLVLTATIAQAGIMVVPISDNHDAISSEPKETKGNPALAKGRKQNVGNVSCRPSPCVPIIGSSSNPGPEPR
jgi:hypothetical protein